MKKKLLAAVLVAGIAIAPMTRAGLMEDLAGLSSILKEMSTFVLQGVGLKETAQGFQDLGDAIEVALKELEKPTNQIDFSKLITVLAEMNEIALAMNEDFKKVMLVMIKPVKKILPKKEVKFGKETVFLDELPGILTEKAVDLLGLYYKLVAKLLNLVVKTKETLKQEESPKEIAEELQIKLEELKGTPAEPERRTIEMDITEEEPMPEPARRTIEM